MEIIPAVDIKNGRCVRLQQGDFSQEKVYADNPVEIACSWQEKGANILHVVDLDGAKDGRPSNMEMIKEIANRLDIPVQVGGGIRKREVIAEYLGCGVSRIIVGTLALENPDIIADLIEQFGLERIVAGVDARDGFVAVKGWLETSKEKLEDVVYDLKNKGVKYFIYTDISRDGMLSGPDIEGLCKLQKISDIEVIASGGITTEKHIKQLEEIGINYAIVGKALYSHKLDYRKLWEGKKC